MIIDLMLKSISKHSQKFARVKDDLTDGRMAEGERRHVPMPNAMVAHRMWVWECVHCRCTSSRSAAERAAW